MQAKSDYCKRRKICTSLQDNSRNFSQFVDILQHFTPWGQKCEEHSFFCPVLLMCLPRNHSCNRESSIPNEMLPRQSPWGEECPATKKFCPLVMACISRSFQCSLKNITSFVLCEKMNATDSTPAVFCNSTLPFGITCLPNTTFCHITMSCIPKNDSCTFKIPFNKTFTCESGERFCPQTGRCIPNGHLCGTRIKYNLTHALNGTHKGTSPFLST